jgi:hypothetical protein
MMRYGDFYCQWPSLTNIEDQPQLRDFPSDRNAVGFR